MNATARILRMGEIIAQRSTAEWLARLDACDVPCAPILRRGEVIHNEQILARELIAEFDQPGVGKVRQPKPAARFDVTEARAPSPAPRIGEHTAEILAELGYARSDIEAMARDKVVRLGAGDEAETRKVAS